MNKLDSAWDCACPKCGEKKLKPIGSIELSVGYDDGEKHTVPVPYKGIGCTSCRSTFIDSDAHEYMMTHILEHQEAEHSQPKAQTH